MAMRILQRQTVVLPMQHSSSSTRRRTAEIADPERGEEEDKAGRGAGWLGGVSRLGGLDPSDHRKGNRCKISTLAVNRFLRVPAMPSTTAV